MTQTYDASDVQFRKIRVAGFQRGNPTIGKLLNELEHRRQSSRKHAKQIDELRSKIEAFRATLNALYYDQEIE